MRDALARVVWNGLVGRVFGWWWGKTLTGTQIRADQRRRNFDNY
jgi:hypothetical protein